MHPSLFYRPGALLSQSELSSARIDGILVEIGEGYMPADVPEDPAARATSLRPLLPSGHALCGPTAAWVYGVGDAPPSRHHVQRVSARRPRVQPVRTVVLHERIIDESETHLIGITPVTTRLRTLTDLVMAAGNDAETAVWMTRFADGAPSLLPQVRSIIAGRERLPGKRAALARIDELRPYEDVTRYTS